MNTPFSSAAPMVRALLAGTKTQTRRAWRVQPPPGVRVGWTPDSTTPYGKAGDRLWVRETWQGPLMSSNEFEAHGNDDPGSLPARFESPSYCQYAADGGSAPEFMTADDELVCRWRPSIHMPRWASRITLEITGVRVERLQDISEADAIAEGIEPIGCNWRDYLDGGNDFTSARRSYRSLWESINGAGSWDANPWVWVVEFRRASSA